MIIHLKRATWGGPYITIFQRDLQLSFEEIDKPLSETVRKYFLKHASNCFREKNIVLSLYLIKSPLLAINAVKTSTSLPSPQNVNITILLVKRSSRLKHYTTESKVVLCVTSDVDSSF